MATTAWKLPTINGTDTVDGVNAINGLANAVDTALTAVNTTASGAATAASTAQQTANTAKTSADTATKNASSALTAAQEAGDQAAEAQTTAAQASASADTAKTNAANALATANSNKTRLDAKPMLYPQADKTIGAGVVYSNYVYSSLANYVTCKAYCAGISFSAASTVALFTLPSDRRPTAQFEQLIAFNGSGSLILGVNAQGVVSVTASAAGTYTANGILGFFVNAAQPASVSGELDFVPAPEDRIDAQGFRVLSPEEAVWDAHMREAEATRAV